MTRKLTLATTLFLLAAIPSASAGKRSIYGFTPMMTFDEAKAFATQHYPGCTIERAVIAEGPMCAGVTLWFAADEPGNPLMSVVLQMRTPASNQAIIASLSGEYGKPLQEVRFATGAVSHYEATLDDGNFLRFTPMNRVVVLANAPMMSKAAAQKIARENGQPK